MDGEAAPVEVGDSVVDAVGGSRDTLPLPLVVACDALCEAEGEPVARGDPDADAAALLLWLPSVVTVAAAEDEGAALGVPGVPRSLASELA